MTKGTQPNATSLSISASFNQSAHAEHIANRSGPYTMAHNNGVAFLSLSAVTPDTYDARYI